VSDSITWRQFCRIGLDQPVPHPTTLMKLTTRCGSAAVDGLNEALLAKGAGAKVLRCSREWVDTTVIPANVANPTDSGLLAKGIRRIAATARRIQAAGGGPSSGTGRGLLGTRLTPAIERLIRRTGRRPGTVAADRGYGEAAIDDSLHALGITHVVIPCKDRPSPARQAEERQRTFRRHVKWRTGCEGRISHLKRSYGWDHSMIDTTEGARTWCGHGVLAHNLTKIAALTA